MAQMEDNKNQENLSVDIHEILKYLPHRYPFLLVDRVLSCEPGKDITALKNVTINEPFFSGHFPHYPVMPGVLIIEALAQAAGYPHAQDRERKTGREFDFLFRRHRCRALQKAGAAGRPVDTQGNDIAGTNRYLEVFRQGGSGWPRRCGGRVDVHSAQQIIV